MHSIFSVSLLATCFLVRVSFADDLAWKVIKDKRALCNDYTPAGYFVASGRTPEHWVIFLESGGGCYSPTTCNARYFSDNVRTKFKNKGSLSVGPLVSYDVSKAKSSVLSAGDTLSAFVSPLVTSMLTFQNTGYFKNGRLSVQGQGILDDNCTNNPIFCNHTRVIIPYCSSDLWLANSPSENCNISKDLYDKCYANVSSCVDIGKMYFENCFLNSSNQLSFVFRGQAIYRGALQQLLDEGLNNSATVTLVGSSAGGVGVVNHANWTLQLLRNWTRGANLSVIADSSWFINFQDNVYKLFVGLERSGSVQSGGVFSIITATDTTSVTCKDITRGTPCCFSAFCMLTTPEYYPAKDVSTFMLFGLYDVYLLAESLIGLGISEVGKKNGGAGLAVKFIQTVSEYGGAMNDSLSVSSRGVARLSYYVTQCFQHIYLVTSTLWGVGNLLGNQAVEISASFASYTESISLNTWSSMKVGINKTTIKDALDQWYPNRYTTVMTIRDDCSGPHCNSMCPEQIVLASPSQNTWSKSAKTALLVIAGGIGVLCVLFKVLFILWLCFMERYQHHYLTKLLSSNVDEKLQFPECLPENSVSVSCLDLCYSVTVKAKKVKDEKKDQTTAIVLGNLSEPEKDGEEGAADGGNPSKYKHLISQSVEMQKRNSVVEMVGHFKQNSNAPPLFLDENKNATCFGTYTEKKILNSISMYFNPGQLTGIMGPSGCGKTTFLDLLTGRRKTGAIEGKVLVNGLPIEQIKDWYIANTGYILQLATSYYEELTVRENLTLAAQIKLPSTFTLRDKFTRIEQVLAVSELLPFAETVVGTATGPGLSGGQKRRLAIALQLLKLPSVLFLDEPTSGLDATSSYELLTHLNRLADSKRTIILTIHQPRLEIFHLFHRLILLTDGKIAYHGSPERAYEHFVQALKTSYKEKGYVIPQLEDHNPADIIMDMLGNPERRAILTNYFRDSKEPDVIRKEIEDASKKSTLKLRKKLSGDDESSSRRRRWTVHTQSIEYLSFALFGAQKVEGKHGNIFNRLAALEARGSKRASFGQMLYLPVIFFAYGVLLGTVYYQSYSPLLVMSGFCVYSVASALFMFPALYIYYQRALEVYAYEHADGVGNPWDIVIQGFIRGITLGFFPVILCASILYLLLVNSDSYNFQVFGQVLLINLALNQTWVALLIFVICAFPKIAFRLSPIISSVAGFTSGFFVPRDAMPPYYRWLFYINPNYYGFSASANLLLDNLNTGCVGSVFECFPSSPQYYLKYFNFDDVNPYLHITILLSFTVIFLLLAVFSHWFRYTTAYFKIKRFVFVLALLFKDDPTIAEPKSSEATDSSTNTTDASKRLSHKEFAAGGVGQDQSNANPDPHHDDVTTTGNTSGDEDMMAKASGDGLVIRNKSVTFKGHEEDYPEKGEGKPHPLLHRRTTFLEEGENHKVHVPLTVVSIAENGEEEEKDPPQRQRKVSIWERQKTLNHRLQAVREVLKEADIEEELSEGEEEEEEEKEEEEKEEEEEEKEEGHYRSRDLWKMAAKRVATKASVVSELKQKAKKAEKNRHSFHHAINSLLLQQEERDRTSAERSVPVLLKKQATIHNVSRQLSEDHMAHKPRLVPIAKWKELVRRATSMDEAKPESAPAQDKELPTISEEMDGVQSREETLSPNQVVVIATIERDGALLSDKGSHVDCKGAHLNDKGLNANGEGTDLHDSGTHPVLLQTRRTSRPHLEKAPNVDQTTQL